MAIAASGLRLFQVYSATRSYNGKSKCYDNNSCLFGAAPSSHKSRKKIIGNFFFSSSSFYFFFSQGAKEEVRYREDFADGLPLSLLGCPGCKAHRNSSTKSPGEGTRAPVWLLHSAPEAEEALLSTALVELSTQCL